MGFFRGGFTGIFLVMLLIIFLFLGAPLLCKSIPQKEKESVNTLNKIARLEKGDSRIYVVRKVGGGKKIRKSGCYLYPTGKNSPTYKLCFNKKKRLANISRKPVKR